LGFALGGCASNVEPTAEAPSPADVRQYIARDLVSEPCPKPSEASPPPDRDLVFVELFVMDAPRRLADAATLQNLQQVVAAPDVEALAAPHVMGDYERETAIELGDVQGKTERVTLHRLRTTARHAEPDLTVLELELTLQLPNPRAQLPNPTRSLTVKIPTRDDAPALARVVWDETRQRSLLLLVRPRAVRSELDLRGIFECKMRKRLTQRLPP
jgi:hypothetical protein